MRDKRKKMGAVALVNARRDASVRRRVAYTAFVVLVSLVLSHIPVYGVNASIVKSLFGSAGILNFTDALSGGGLSQLAVGGFAVTSIIMAGILMQLISIAFPRFEEIRRLGEMGRRRYEQLSMGLACAITLVMGIVIMATSHSSLLYKDVGWMAVIPVAEWFLGTLVVAVLAQRVQDHGLGNGPTAILAANIATALPGQMVSTNWSAAQGLGWGVVIVLVAVVVAVIMQESRLEVPIQQTRKPLSVMNAEGTLPMPLGISSVLPIVYASALFMMPSLVVTLGLSADSWFGKLSAYTQTYVMYSGTWQGWVSLAVYVLFVVGFSFFASRLTFSSAEVANRMRERGDVIVGVAPGHDTEVYLEKRRRKLAIISALMLVAVAVLPDLALSLLGITGVQFAGTSMVIMVGAFWQTRMAYVGMTRHRSRKYNLFGMKEVA